jgi:hypothetical protein
LCPLHKVELQQQNISQQLKKYIQIDEPRNVYYLLVSKSDFQYVFGSDFLPSRTFSNQHNHIHDFANEDDLWELLRFKSTGLDGLEHKLSEIKLNQIRGGVSLWWEGLKSPILLQLNTYKVCPVCKHQSTPVSNVGAFSPFSALGACKSCNGYGANLVYNENKLMDKELSVDDGALKLLNYGPFQDYFFSLKKIMKKKNFSSSVPIKKLSKDFFDILENGYGEYPGYADLKAYLESKKYRPSVRIYIRNLQKEEPCLICDCSRLNKDIHHFVVSFQNRHFSLPAIMAMSISEALDLFKQPLNFFSESGKKNCSRYPGEASSFF